MHRQIAAILVTTLTLVSLATADKAPPPPPPRKPKVTEFKVQQTLKLPGSVVFETNSDQLSPVSDDVLEYVQAYLLATPDATLQRIEGHMSAVNPKLTPAELQSLSERRALSVARWLVAQGIKCDRLLPVGFGGDKPVVCNDTPDHQAENQRIDFVTAAVRGKPINGAVDGGGKVAGDPCH